MFRAMIPLICRSTRLFVTPCGIKHPLECRPVAWKRRNSASRYRPATSWVHCTTSCNTQSSAPEDGRDQRPKHVELIRIINKPLLLYLVGVYTIYMVILCLLPTMTTYHDTLTNKAYDALELRGNYTWKTACVLKSLILWRRNYFFIFRTLCI